MSARVEPVPRQASSRRSALSNLGWLVGDKVAALFLGLLIQGLIARAYGPSGTGHFAYAFVLLQLTLGLSMVCAGVALLPRFCRKAHLVPGALANIFVLRVAASVVAVLIMWSMCLATIDELERLEVAMALVAAAPLIEPFYLFATYWQSRNDNRPTVLARGLGVLLRTVLVAIGAAMGVPIWLLALAWIADASVNAWFQVRQVRAAFVSRTARRQVRLSRMWPYLRFGLRFVLGLWLLQLFLRIDRLVLAEHLDAHDFGLYAAPMQLIEVWAQMAYLIGSALAPAYLYKALRGPHAIAAFTRTFGVLASIGLLGLFGAWLLGDRLLDIVYGNEFIGSYPTLLAGAAGAIFVFADQAVDLTLMAANRPRWLTIKWAAACVACAITVSLGFAWWGVLAGPAGIALGLAAGWLVTLVTWRLQAQRGTPVEPVNEG